MSRNDEGEGDPKVRATKRLKVNTSRTDTHIKEKDVDQEGDVECEYNENETPQKDYNPNNYLLPKWYVEGLLKKVFGTDIQIYDLRKYQLAFVHKSVKMRDLSPPNELVLEDIARARKEGIPIENVTSKYGTWNNGEPVIFTQTYESLEFVGDGWIGAIVGDYLYHRFPRQNEGFLTKLKQQIVCKDGLAGLAKFVGFDKYIILSSMNEEKYGRETPSYMEDVFEAFCAAIKQDLGKQILDLFIKNIIEASIDFEKIITINSNYKDGLMRFFQENGWQQPTYSDISRDGPVHKRVYTVGVDWFQEIDSISNYPIIEINVNTKESLDDVFNELIDDIDVILHKSKHTKDDLMNTLSNISHRMKYAKESKMTKKKFLAISSSNSKKEAQKQAAKMVLDQFKMCLENEIKI